AAICNHLQDHTSVGLSHASHLGQDIFYLVPVKHRSVADDEVEFVAFKRQANQAGLMKLHFLDFPHLRFGARQLDALGARIDANDLASAFHSLSYLYSVSARPAVYVEYLAVRGEFD